MIQVDLPLVPMSTGLATALSRLRRSKRAALLSEHDGKYHLFHAENIVVGRSQGIKTLSELSAHAKLKPKIVITHVFVPARKARGGPSSSLRGGINTKKAAPRHTVKSKLDFSLQQVIGESAFLSVRSMNLAEKFVAGPSDCYCDGPRHHSFPPPEVAAGDPCPRCGHTVVCSR